MKQARKVRQRLAFTSVSKAHANKLYFSDIAHILYICIPPTFFMQFPFRK